MSLPPIAEELSAFDGISPLFPLPNVVYFPEILLPLHVFEARYRKMTADTLANGSYLSMALLQPGVVSLSDPPPIHPTVCLGKIIAHEELADGRYYLVLRGLSRARVVHEMVDDEPYRSGRVELIDDCYPNPAPFDREKRRDWLIRLFRRRVPGRVNQPAIDQALAGQLSFGQTVDALAYGVYPETDWMQQFLEDPDVDSRSERLLRLLGTPDSETEPSDEWPPPFSLN